jgi:hypothetical protein
MAADSGKVLKAVAMVVTGLACKTKCRAVYQSDGHSPEVSGREVAERWPGKAKTGEKAELALAKEHFEAVFNAAWPSVGTYRPGTKVLCVLPDA